MADQSQIKFEPSPWRRLVWTLVMLGLIVGAGLVLWRAYQLRQSAILAEGETPQSVQETMSDPTGSTAAPEAPTATTPPEEFVSRAETSVELPPLPASLSDSDLWLRQELAHLDQNPEFAKWSSQTAELLRCFVVLVSEVAQGRVPANLFGFWAPQEAIQVKEIGDREYVLDPASYHRYDRLALAVEALDPELAWRLYQHLKPLIEQVYAEFGQPGTSFDQVLVNAIEHLLKTPQLAGEIRLIKPSVMYQYADPKLEALSAAQKQLLRMGPVNAAIVKHKLGLLRGLLGQR